MEDDIAIELYAKNAAPMGLPLSRNVRWHTIAAPFWLPLAVPRALRAGRVEVFHGTNHMVPPVTAIPTVVTIHDVSLLLRPGHHTWRNRLLTSPQMLLSLRRARYLIADSVYTATELAQLGIVKREHIRVIPLAAAPGLAPATPDRIQRLIHKFALPATFFLFVGALGPNKNVLTLVRAFGNLCASSNSGVHLVIASADSGQGGGVYDEVRRLGLAERVRFLGYVQTGDLPALFGAARAFVYPSLFEGFGLPPLEAMTCGAPVICSNTTSLPEVTGDAAVTVNPTSVDDLAASLRLVLEDDDLRARLKLAGLTRASRFSWDRTARETLQVYADAVADGHPRQRP